MRMLVTLPMRIVVCMGNLFKAGRFGLSGLSVDLRLAGIVSILEAIEGKDRDRLVEITKMMILVPFK